MTGNATLQPARYFDQGPHPACAVLGGWRGAVSLHRLCEQPLAASDYLRLAHDYHTLMIDRIPVMDYPERNAAKRFITLIDTLYDNAVKLMASAEAEPQSLYLAPGGPRGQRIQTDLLAADRDGLAILSGACRMATRTPPPADRPRGWSRLELQRHSGRVEDANPEFNCRSGPSDHPGMTRARGVRPDN